MFEPILTAVDGSEYDRKAIGATRELARLVDSTVRVIHVRQATSWRSTMRRLTFSTGPLLNSWRPE